MSPARRRYDRMRASGVAWLGDVPDHWQVLPNRALFHEVKSQGHDAEELLSVTIARGVIRQAELLAASSKKDSSNIDKAKYKLVEPGDIAYNKMRAWQGAIGASPHRGIVSPAYVVQRLRRNGSPWFYHYLFRTRAFAREAERWSYGITSDQWSLRPEQFRMIYSCKPPAPEQELIVRYLDFIDSTVAKLVTAKKRLIVLIEEELRAICDRVITLGVDETPLKSTNSRWVPQLPSHWEVRRLHLLLDPGAPLAYGILLPGPQLDQGAPYIGAGDVRPERLHRELLPKTTEEIATAYPRTRMHAGDLVYAIRGSFGRVEVIPDELEGVNLSRDAARLAPRRGVNPEWLAYALRSHTCQQQFLYREIGATITGVNIRDLKRVLLPVPPPDEQVRIVDHLRSASATPRAAIAAAEREIRLISEYRERLTADVVTGNVDVRDIAASLPARAEATPARFDGAELDLDADDEFDDEVTEALA